MCASDDIMNHKHCFLRLVLPQQVKTRSGGYLGLVWGEFGERNFDPDSLESRLNRDMEEKGFVLRELSCRKAAGAPPAGVAGVGSSGRTPCQAVTWQSD